MRFEIIPSSTMLELLFVYRKRFVICKILEVREGRMLYCENLDNDRGISVILYVSKTLGSGEFLCYISRMRGYPSARSPARRREKAS